MNKELKPLNPKDIKYLIVHCSATRCDRNFSVESLIETGEGKYGQPSYYHKNKIIRRQSRYHSLSD
jgi:hypothetical protein